MQLSHDPHLCSGQAAQLLGMSRYTVNKLIDNRTLRGYRLPGTKIQQRRVALSEVQRVAHEVGIPIDK